MIALAGLVIACLLIGWLGGVDIGLYGDPGEDY